MVKLKTPEEIKIMAEAGKRLRAVVKDLFPQIKPGITTKQIDDEAERLIRKAGGEPSFQRVKNYYWSTCLPINEQAVHTPPSDRVVKAGDALTVDIGLFYHGFHSDFARTFVVGQSRDKKIDTFLAVGSRTLEKAIERAKTAKYIGDISTIIESEIYGNGYCILKELTGHGIGRDLHEEPYVLGYTERPAHKTYKIRAGLVIAIEVIYSMSSEEIAYEKGSDWSIVSRDRSMAACFEDTVAYGDNGFMVLT